MGFGGVLGTADFLVSNFLLPVFFFTIGAELVQEFRTGELSNLKKAALPAFAALGGVIIPALIYISVIYYSGNSDLASSGWAIPTATDVAFSLAVLTFLRKYVKPACKLFLTVLAVIDDIIGILIITIFFGNSAPPLTIIAVILGIIIGYYLQNGKIMAVITKLSNYIVVPVFAIVSIVHSAYALCSGLDEGDFASNIFLYLPLAITLALVIGKPLGILLFAWIGAHLTPLKLFHGLRVRDLIGTAMLGGIGFTVSFFVASLSFANINYMAIARAGVIIGSVISAILGAIYIVISAHTLKYNRAERQFSEYLVKDLNELPSLDEVQKAILERSPEHQIDPSLARVQGALKLLGNPQNRLKIVHITGTNGKTSTATMIRNILRNSGLKTGLFTSPHILSITERIQVSDGIETLGESSIRKNKEFPEYLRENAKLARETASIILEREVTDTEIERVLEEPLIMGRFQKLEIDGVKVILDVAHNSHGARSLAKELVDSKPIIAVVAQFEDKDTLEYLRALKPVVDTLIVSENSSARSRKTRDLAKIASIEGFAPILEPDLKQAVDLALKQADEYGGNVTVLITGSVITVADSLQYLQYLPGANFVNNSENESAQMRSSERRFIAAFLASISAIEEFEARNPTLGKLSFFEVLTCMMYLEFAALNVDIAIVEVGMGGSWDATNVMDKTAVSVIAPIALDHMSYLGDTLTQIASEKAGILKRNAPAVIAPQIPEVQAVLNAKQQELGQFIEFE